MRQITAQSLFYTALTSLILIGALFFISQRFYNRQVDIWLSTLPKTITIDLMDSDNFAVGKKVAMVGATGLFSSVVVKDASNRMVANFGKSDAELQSIKLTDDGGVVWGSFHYEVRRTEMILPLLAIAVISLLAQLVLYLFVRSRTRSALSMELSGFFEFLKKLERVVRDLSTATLKAEPSPGIATIVEEVFSGSSRSEESAALKDSVRQLVSIIQENQKEIISITQRSEQEKGRAEIAKIAVQVAHDIRSPLTALNIATDKLDLLPEQERMIVRAAVSRIMEIANQLLTPHRDANPDAAPSTAISAKVDDGPTPLTCLLDDVVREKTIQFDGNSMVLDYESGPDAYATFVSVNRGAFKTVVSNIINNAREALTDGGLVQVRVQNLEKEVVVRITDDGPGMTPQVLEAVRTVGGTYGKVGGHGLGLSHARACMAEWGGRLEIDSVFGKGTEVKLVLPRIAAPSWFPQHLVVSKDMRLVVVDDDPSIHHVWDRRFAALAGGLEEGHVGHYYDPTEFAAHFSGQSKRTLFLVDYQFRDSEVNGMSLIKRYNLMNRSILVTSKFEDPELVDECIRSGVKLLPKSLADSIPLEIA